MEEKIINWQELKKKLKVQEIKLKAKEVGSKALDAGKKTVEYVGENKEAILILTGAVAGIGKIAHSAAKVKEEKRKATTMYDHSSNQYVTLRRPLKQKEKLEAYERNQAGEKYVDIYKSMGLIK